MAESRPSFDERLAELIEDKDSATHKAIFGEPKKTASTKASGDGPAKK